MALFDVVFSFGILPTALTACVYGLRSVVPVIKGDDLTEKACLALMVGVFAISAVKAVLPAFDFPAVMSVPLLADFSHGGPMLALDQPQPAPPIDFGLLGLWLLGIVYGVGVGAGLLKLGVGLARLARLERTATPSPEGFHSVSNSPHVALASISGKVLLSDDFLAAASVDEVRQVVDHERCHIKRYDPLAFTIYAILDAVFWFNPFIRLQTGNCRLAAEIACDRAVLMANPEMRRTYASTLVSALKHTAGNARPCVPAAFSLRRKGEYRMRIENIMRPKQTVSKSIRMGLVTAAAMLVLPVGAMQFAVAETAKGFMLSSYPVDGPITADFGQRKDPLTGEMKLHSGIDFKAPLGTAVLSPAAGVVVFADLKGNYGNLLAIDHGNGMITRYAMLDSFDVSVGDRVAKGQKIAEVGQTGRSTAPHLHFEVLENGERTDPSRFLIR